MKKKHRLYLILVLLGVLVAVSTFFLLESYIIPLIGSGTSGEYSSGSATFNIVVSVQTIAISLAAGILVGLVSVLYPALKATQVDIVDSLTPTRVSHTKEHMVRERGVSRRLITYGIVISGVSAFMFFVLPSAFTTGNTTSMSMLFLGMMVSLLIGFTFIGLGVLVPGIERLLTHIIRPITRRINDIVAMYLRKHRRRNTLTAIMYSISIAFILFLSTMLTVQTEYRATTLRAEIGTDLSLVSTTSSIASSFRPVTSETPIWINDTELIPKIKEIDGVVDITRVSHENHPNGSSTVRMGDLMEFETVSASVYAVDTNFPNVTYFDIASFTAGDDSAFETINKVENTTIISEGAAKRLNVNVGDHVTIKVQRNLASGIEVSNTVLRVVAIANDMPAFSNFVNSESGYSDVLVSQHTYALIFDLYEDQDIDRTDKSELEDYVEPVERLLIKTTSSEAAKSVGRILTASYGVKEDVNVRVTEEEIESAEESLESLQLFFTIALGFGMIIAFFGLTASCYTTIQESIPEIGIMKSIGLDRKHITNIFMFESIILTLASGLAGLVVGYLTGLSLIAQQAIYAEQPLPLFIPWTELALVIIASILIGAIGARIPSRTTTKKTTAEILRMR